MASQTLEEERSNDSSPRLRVTRNRRLVRYHLEVRLALPKVLLVSVVAVFAAQPACGSIGSPPGSGNIDAGPYVTNASCTDGSKNGTETDIDCGGTCSPCANGAACNLGSDCTSDLCGGNLCVVAESCQGIAMIDSGAVDGVYSLAPGGVTIDAYCRFDSAGGWTLLARFTSTTTTFAYDSGHWTTSDVLNETDLTPNAAAVGAEAKFAAFNSVAGAELVLEFLDPDHDLTFAMPAVSTALALFSGPEVALLEHDTNDCNDNFLTAAPGYTATFMRHGQANQFYGANGSDTAGGDTRNIRFGFGSTAQDDDPWQPTNGIGTTNGSLLWSGDTVCDNDCDCYGTLYRPTETSANLWLL